VTARRLAPLLAATLALWATWAWLWLALTGRGADRWGLVALGVAGVLFVSRLREREEWQPSPGLLALAAASLVAHAISWGLLPRLVSAGFGALGLGFVALFALAPQARRRSWILPVLGVLALPLGPSLDYVCGYPMRVVSGTLAAWLLEAGGMEAASVGATLRVEGRAVFLDPACSGIHMLWTTLLLSAVLGAVHGARPARLSILTACAAGLAVVANAWRSAALAAAEVRVAVGVPGWLHEAVGLCAFALVAVVLLNLSRWRMKPCAS